MEYKDKISVVLNSKNRTLPSPLENPLFTLETPIENVRGIEITGVSIPFSWYRFHDSEDLIQTPDGEVAVYYGINNATPTCTELAAEIQTRVRAVLSWNDFVCTYSTYKFTLSRDTNFTIYVDETTVENSTLMKTIGFSVSLSGASSYTSEVPISDNRIRINRYDLNMIISNTTATLNSGIYTGDELATEYNTALQIAFGTTDYSAAYKPYQMKTVVYYTGGAFSATNNSSSGAAFPLGYRGINQASTTEFNTGNNMLLPISCTDLNGATTIKVKSHVLSRCVNYYSNQVCSVPVNRSKGEFITHLPQTTLEFKTPQTISQIDFRLTSEDDTFLNLNGINWSISISFNI